MNVIFCMNRLINVEMFASNTLKTIFQLLWMAIVSVLVAK